ncbi:MAG: leucyl/phenylalanyl-tRNA--protein transferase [Gammaproteobacteria bacterium]|nr:leucyl/phenylalanyl-tRNA--protein transferase [Gammaproteobacteria bacterium]
MSALHWIDPQDEETPFPPVELALREPDGLLAVGGSLSTRRLLAAYRQGIFPWYSEGQPVMWWSPDPRAVLFPDHIRVSRSLRKRLRRGDYEVRCDTAFREVVRSCAAPRPGQDGTWITAAMADAFGRLHRQGYAHSVEVRQGAALVGGLYGVAIGRVFFGESMFSRRSDASKVALVHLARQLQAWGFALIDCQVHSEHLASLGAVAIPRRRFTRLLARACYEPGRAAPWRLDPELPVGVEPPPASSERKGAEFH